jgi:leader peptidase (prepilin peptidase) / N-methyltransferase
VPRSLGEVEVNAAVLAAALGFAVLGGGAERLASVWPPEEASRRRPGARTVALAVASGAAGGGVVWRATEATWAVLVVLLIVAILVLLTATDLEQRRLPHLLLDPLLLVALLFVPFNPALGWSSALVGAAASAAFLGALGVVVRQGVALGDLLLVIPLGLLLGWPAIFAAMFIAGIGSAIFSIGLLLSRRAGLKTYIPFGPFLVGGAVITLIRDPVLLGPVAAAASVLFGR